MENELGSDSLKRILQFESTLADDEKVEAAVFHYTEFAKAEIFRGLDWKSKIYYQTIFHWDKWAAGSGLFVSAGGLYAAAKKISEDQMCKHS